MIRFATFMILIPALLHFAPDAHAQSTAGWALTEIRRDTSRLEKRDPPGKLEAISDMSAKVLLRLGPNNYGNYAAIESAHKWSPPPVILKPGDEIRIDLGLEARIVEANWQANNSATCRDPQSEWTYQH